MTDWQEGACACDRPADDQSGALTGAMRAREGRDKRERVERRGREGERECGRRRKESAERCAASLPLNTRREGQMLNWGCVFDRSSIVDPLRSTRKQLRRKAKRADTERGGRGRREGKEKGRKSARKEGETKEGRARKEKENETENTPNGVARDRFGPWPGLAAPATHRCLAWLLGLAA